MGLLTTRIKRRGMVSVMAKHEYRVDGKLVPGVTSILQLKSKPALIPWAWKMSREHPEFKSLKAFSQIKMDTGTLAHEMIHRHLKGETFEMLTSGIYTAEQIEGAENALLSFLEWEKKQVEFAKGDLEWSLVSEMYGYGGTIDCYCILNGKRTIIDFKTGGIWPEHFSQISAYRQLVWEAGYGVEQGLVLSLPIAENEEFAEEYVKDWTRAWNIFNLLRQIWEWEK